MLTLLRLGLMVLAIAPIFTGFGLPYFVAGWPGFALGLGLIVGGSALLWIVHQRTRHWLDADTALNRLLKTDGELILGDRAERDPEPAQDQLTKRD